MLTNEHPEDSIATTQQSTASHKKLVLNWNH